jgi:hypothetical protein
MNEDSTCPDCGGTLDEIRIIDKAHGGGHQALEYALMESKRSFWMSRYPVEGKIAAYMCGGCGRVLLCGRPAAEE